MCLSAPPCVVFEDRGEGARGDDVWHTLNLVQHASCLMFMFGTSVKDVYPMCDVACVCV